MWIVGQVGLRDVGTQASGLLGSLEEL